MSLFKYFVLLVFLLISCSVPADQPVVSLGLSVNKVDISCDLCDDYYHIMHRKSLFESSRESSVMVQTVGMFGPLGGASGGYFKYRGQYYVVTAAHVVIGGPIIVVQTETESVVATKAYVDVYEDIAVLKIPELSSRKALNLRVAPKDSISVGEELVYSGYPALDGLKSFKATVSSFDTADDIIVDSFGWPGASGSCLLDQRGRLIGVVSGLRIEEMWGDKVILENMIIIIPAWKINLDALK